MPTRKATTAGAENSGLPVWLAGLLLIATAALAARFDQERPPRRGKGTPATGAFNTRRATDEPRDWQYARAAQRGRGRQATSPWEIPWSGWKDIFWRTYEQIGEDRLLANAAGVVFFGLLALFPAITAFVSFYGLFANAGAVQDHLSVLANVLPSGGLTIVQEQIERIASKPSGLSVGFAVGFLIALWSANAGVKAMMDALNVIKGQDERRSFVRLNLLSLSLTLGAIALAAEQIDAAVGSG